MATDPAYFKGCLLGMAVGDAMGVTVDGKRYSQICEAYGPAGLLGYDLANGCAEISSYTQVAAFACNGMLLSIARGQTGVDACVRYVTQALKEWARAQHLPGAPERRSCWLCHIPQMRKRKSMDARTLDSLTRDVLGTPQAPANQGDGPGTLTAAIPVGLFFHPERMQVDQIGLLGARLVALTHGDPMTFLSGAVLAYAVAGIIQDPACPMEEQFSQAAAVVQTQFGEQYPQAAKLRELIAQAAALSRDFSLEPHQAMERLCCETAAQVLCGAVYAVLASQEDFDEAMIIAVNHSGKSAAVGAVTGAVLGAKLGEKALPEFYLDCLEGREMLRELAGDLHTAGPNGWRTRLFDDEWDRKYTHGLPAERIPWEETP